jgi:hypothetical protein
MLDPFLKDWYSWISLEKKKMNLPAVTWMDSARPNNRKQQEE